MINISESPEAKELLRQMKVGIDMEAFINSSIGEYIVQKMLDMNHKAMVALTDVDPEDSSKIRKLQNEAKIPVLMLQTINECIQEYKYAEIQLLSPSE